MRRRRPRSPGASSAPELTEACLARIRERDGTRSFDGDAVAGNPLTASSLLDVYSFHRRFDDRRHLYRSSTREFVERGAAAVPSRRCSSRPCTTSPGRAAPATTGQAATCA